MVQLISLSVSPVLSPKRKASKSKSVSRAKQQNLTQTLKVKQWKNLQQGTAVFPIPLTTPHSLELLKG